MKYWDIASPITVHVEITEHCQLWCRHCYNYDRGDKGKPKEITWEDLNNTLLELHKNKVLHIIITGGEPLLALDKTCWLAQKCLELGMSVSLNSNLVACTPRVAKQLRNAGIDHCLTTFNSCNEQLTGWITGVPTALKKIKQGIKNAQDGGIRVSANLIMTQHNKDQVFDTGYVAFGLGVKKFIAYRVIPSPTNIESLKPEYVVEREDALRMFDDLLDLNRQYGIEVGTNRMVPECLFDNPDDYPEFINRGCSAGKRHMLLNVNGTAHACVHEAKSYGNIHEIGITGVWANMKPWRTMEYIPEDCQTCGRLESCNGGCRMVALACTGSMKGKDNLCRDPFPPQPKAKQVNYREEKDFYIFRTKGANVVFVDK